MPNIEGLVNDLKAKEVSTIDDLKEVYAKTYAFKTIAVSGKTHQISMPDEVFSMLKNMTKMLKKAGVKGKINVNDLTMLLVLLGYSKLNRILQEANVTTG
ncbi:MAG: hypothetical protein QFX33_01055 [Candidatus Nezhaarchaeota archaeon]|nr:hypothetical protein [Candidatus Nezhaarchaeota archaeon]